MRLLRASDRTPAPWKNGGGVTWELAAGPVGAGLDTFDWRISIAEVAVGGPFSSFPGIDRILTVLSGEGMALHVAGYGSTTLGSESEPFAFPGDLPCNATLAAGPIKDLNIMVRRHKWRADARRLVGAGDIASKAEVTILVATTDCWVSEHVLRAEDAVLAAQNETLALARGAAVLIELDTRI